MELILSPIGTTIFNALSSLLPVDLVASKGTLNVVDHWKCNTIRASSACGLIANLSIP